MKRIHFVEIEDQTWCPEVIRRGVTDFLQTAIGFFAVYDPIPPLLKDLASRTHQPKFIDLCSGSGGPWFAWAEKRQFTTPIEVHLTDFYPKPSAGIRQWGEITLQSHSESVSALAVPKELSGIRTSFSSFHHFKPEDAKAILKDSVEKKAPIAIFEHSQRHLLWFAYCVFILPAVALLVTPMMKSLNFSKIIFTYIIPLIPLAVCFDGFVSGLRTYTVEELENLSRGLDSFEFKIGIKKIGFLPIGVSYLIGEPK